MSVEKDTIRSSENIHCPKVMLSPRYKEKEVNITVIREKTVLSENGVKFSNGFNVVHVTCPHLRIHSKSTIRTTCANHCDYTTGDVTHIDVCHFNGVFT